MLDYQTFLTGTVSNLASTGAQMLLPPGSQSRPWTNGWDQLMLQNSPGSPSVYAFTAADRDPLDTIRARVDRLAEGLATSGMSGGVLNLITVFVFSEDVPAGAANKIAALTPSVYYPGMRPGSVAVDLRSRRLYTGGSARRAEGIDVLRSVLEMREGSIIVDPFQVQRVAAEATARQNAFYRLMQGRRPLVTYLLVAVNVLLYVILTMRGGPTSDAALRDLGALSPTLIEQGQWWRLITSMFLHASIPHILFNMTSLVAVGTLAERLYGNSRYLAIYLGSGLIGSLTSFTFAVTSGTLDVLGVGASGAIFGVAGALLTVRFQRSNVIPRLLRERVSSSMMPLVLLSLVMSYLTPHVDNSAHLGGLAGGIFLSFVFPLTRDISAPNGSKVDITIGKRLDDNESGGDTRS